MSNQIVILPFLIVLLTAISTLITRKKRKIRDIISVGGGVLYTFAVANLFSKVVYGDTLTYQLSGWSAPYGISFVADPLSGFMLGLTAVIALPTLLYSVYYMDEYANQLSFQSLFHFMLLGVTGVFLTGDLFNLFVWFEVMLMSSYILVAFYSTGEQTRAAIKYVVINLISSAFMLVAIGGMYAVTGTLNMADMAARLGNPEAYNVAAAPFLGLSAMLYCVFALKSGIAPFQFWVPSAYRAAPAPVSAFLAGAVKKVGIYAIIRLYFGVFSAASLNLSVPYVSGSGLLAFFAPVIFGMAALSVLIGGLGASSRERYDEMLAYSSIGQVGLILIPLAVAAAIPETRILAITASLVYTLNHAVDKTMLFLESGAIENGVGSLHFDDLGGLMDSSKLLAGSFFIGAASLIGIPPMLGFFGKMLVFKATLSHTLALAVAIIGGILTIVYFSRAWNEIFWGEQVDFEKTRNIRIQIEIVTVMALVLFLTGIGFNPVIDAATNAAEAAVSTESYVNAVLGGAQK